MVRSAFAVRDSDFEGLFHRDLVLDVRQFGVALRKLRRLKREGIEEELDLDSTIDKTGRNGGDIDLVFRAPRKSNV